MVKTDFVRKDPILCNFTIVDQIILCQKTTKSALVIQFLIKIGFENRKYNVKTVRDCRGQKRRQEAKSVTVVKSSNRTLPKIYCSVNLVGFIEISCI